MHYRCRTETPKALQPFKSLQPPSLGQFLPTVNLKCLESMWAPGTVKFNHIFTFNYTLWVAVHEKEDTLLCSCESALERMFMWVWISKRGGAKSNNQLLREFISLPGNQDTPPSSPTPTLKALGLEHARQALYHWAISPKYHLDRRKMSSRPSRHPRWKSSCVCPLSKSLDFYTLDIGRMDEGSREKQWL